MARGLGPSGPCRYPAGPRGCFPLPLPLALAILPPMLGDAGDYAGNATARILVEVLGRRTSALALGQTRGNLSTAARRGAAQAARWQAEIPRWCP
jgi:hypothetical protein